MTKRVKIARGVVRLTRAVLDATGVSQKELGKTAGGLSQAWISQVTSGQRKNADQSCLAKLGRGLITIALRFKLETRTESEIRSLLLESNTFDPVPLLALKSMVEGALLSSGLNIIPDQVKTYIQKSGFERRLSETLQVFRSLNAAVDEMNK